MGIPKNQLADTIRNENIRMHDRDSSIYDFRHPYMRDKKHQRRFEVEVSQVEEALGISRPIHALDCGVGTGNLALKFLAKGWEVTAVDISSGMLRVLKEKAGETSTHLELVESDIDQYLSGKKAVFDLVSFGATLHHLPDYLTTLRLACEALKSGGLLYITGEPTSVERISRAEFWLMRFDEYCNILFKILCRPTHLVNVIAKILGKGRNNGVNESLAEFHAGTGIGQDACLSQAKLQGLTALKVVNFGVFGFRVSAFLAKVLGVELKSQFMVIAKKP